MRTQTTPIQNTTPYQVDNKIKLVQGEKIAICKSLEKLTFL
jgi:hypothetical protein